MSTNPWRDCWIAGAAVAVDDSPAYYIPLAHQQGTNLPFEPAIKWLQDVIGSAKRWINHNVKYDANVAANVGGVRFTGQLVDTLTRAKLIDSDRMSYGLEVLSREWLGEDISKYEQALKPYLKNNKDYGRIPSDICGEYACQDVLSNRRLYKFIEHKLPGDCKPIADVEVNLTQILFGMEQYGMRVKPIDLDKKELLILHRLLQIEEELLGILGRSINPVSTEDCYDVMCNQYGLPVMNVTENGSPSFNKAAWAKYASHPFAPQEVVNLILEYRRLSTLKSLFVNKYQGLQGEGRLHPQYNQAVRTGRMSGKDPNPMQLSGDAKELIVPDDGHSFLSIDYSQIEFRTIGHYIKDVDVIAAYKENPDTDFHQWVADEIGISRKPAKTVNFAIAYGQGRKSTLQLLSTNMELVGKLKEKAGDNLELFNKMCLLKADDVYNTYHATLPTLKQTARRADRSAQQKGYVFNFFGRRRHLRSGRTHIAFNTLNQSSAADLIKTKMVEIASILPPEIQMVTQVHDELLFHGPSDEIGKWVEPIIRVMEAPIPGLRVPLRASYGISDVDWREASKGELKIPYHTSG